ncbi:MULTISPECIES: restriction endonuclease subunit S [Gordonia]|uniref:restriction endonuclease subunit S n=1 Tax=Gordonia TaxID=2053 RepID=UPI00339184AE
MSEFASHSLLALTEAIVDNRGRTCPTVPTGMPLIATNCLKPGHRYPVFEKVRYVDPETYATWFRGHPQPGDVLFVTKGSPGRVAVVPDPVNFCVAQDMVALRANRDLVNGSYLYYRLLANDVLEDIEGMHVGTMIPHFKKGDFDNLPIRIHASAGEQRAIAEVLGALDDKIAVNTTLRDRIDELLAAEFSNIFKIRAWTTLGDIAEVNNCVVRPGSGSLRYLDIASVGRGSFERPKQIEWKDAPGRARRVVAEGDTVWSTVRPNRRSHALILEKDTNIIASTGLAVLTPRSGWYAGVYEASRTERFADYLESVAEGSAYPAVRGELFELAPVPALADAEWAAFEGRAQPLRRLAHAASEETHILSDTRDQLLPLLMSGKVTVKDVEGDINDLL